MQTYFPRPEYSEVLRRRGATHVTSLHVPAVWKEEDWNTRCEVCHKPTFMASKAEAMLPAGPIEVMRCSGCSRALWYRSESTENLLNVALTIARWGALTHARAECMAAGPFESV
jgi:hypothetical protein